MKWSEIFSSSVGKKLVMGLTGLFLVSFLVVHAGINACIWANDNGEMFNKAAHFMAATVVIKVMEVGLFLGIFIHMIQGLQLVFQNRSRRKQGYAVELGSKGSTWYSRSMGLLGTLLLLFLLLHWSDFWVPAKITKTINETEINGVYMHDMYAKMLDTFRGQPLVVIAYVIGCISLFWHLLHGFQSAFRTLGVHNPRYNELLQKLGLGYSIIISLAFAMMPVSIYFEWVG